MPRRGNCRGRRIEVAYSDAEQGDSKSHSVLPVVDDSYREGPLSGLEHSQSSLNKRLASVAGLDDSAPTDFNFLFEQNHAKRFHRCEAAVVESTGRLDPCKSSGSSAGAPDVRSRDDGSKVAPASFEDGTYRWVRTEITRGADLVDGSAWIEEYRRQLAATASTPTPDAENVAGSRRGSGELILRNRILRQMEHVSPPGKKVRLATGQEVIFWFNVGAPGPPRSRVLVTDARCPHQGVCLLKGELLEIEDAAGIRRAMSRCPRHNKTFDLKTGTSQGNSEVLKTFPSQFVHGHWYVGISITDNAFSSEVEHRSTNSIAEIVASLAKPSPEVVAPPDASTSSGFSHKRIRAGHDDVC